LSNYQTSVDIANRALQHVGGKRIVTLADDSVNASAVSFCYDKLREAELRRNVWVFSIRKAALRPVDTNTQAPRPGRLGYRHHLRRGRGRELRRPLVGEPERRQPRQSAGQ
jgi:hypothetical protein